MSAWFLMVTVSNNATTLMVHLTVCVILGGWWILIVLLHVLVNCLSMSCCLIIVISFSHRVKYSTYIPISYLILMSYIAFRTAKYSYMQLLRIPDTCEAKIAKIGNFWTFCPVIGLLAELQAITSRSCIFLLILPYKHQVNEGSLKLL